MLAKSSFSRRFEGVDGARLDLGDGQGMLKGDMLRLRFGKRVVGVRHRNLAAAGFPLITSDGMWHGWSRRGIPPT